MKSSYNNTDKNTSLPYRPEDEEPLPLIRPMPPSDPFPVNVLPAVMRDAVIRVHEVVQAPLDMVCQSFLAAATLAVQPFANVHIDGRYFPVSNNFICVGSSGERKSATDRIATGPIKDRQRLESKDFFRGKAAYDATYAAWENNRKEAMREKDPDAIERMLKSIGDEPKHIQPFYLIQEPTIEGIERTFQEGRYTLGLFNDEGGQFIGGYSMSKEHQIKSITVLSKLWDGEPLDRIRKGDGASVLYGRRFSTHLMIQPVICGQLFGSSMLTGQGFLSRCLCMFPTSTIGGRVYKEEDLSTDLAIIRYCDRINALMEKPLPLNDQADMGLNPPPIGFTPEAKRTWIKFHNDIEALQKDGGKLSPVRGFASKAAEHAARVAGVLTLFDDPDAIEIATEAATAGIAIAQYYTGEALRLFHTAGDDPELINAQKVFDWGMQQEGQLIALTELMHSGPNSVRTKKDANRMMDILEAHHRALPIDGGAIVNKVHRRKVWWLRPELFTAPVAIPAITAIPELVTFEKSQKSQQSQAIKFEKTPLPFQSIDDDDEIIFEDGSRL